MALTKSELIENLAKIESTRKRSGEILESLLEIIKKTLGNGEDVLISGFGKFSVKDKGERRGARNFATGDNLTLNARRVVVFRCSPVLKGKVNGTVL